MFAMTILGWTLSTIWAVMILIVWIAIAFWPARVAARKGRSFWGWFFISIFFWFITLIVAYMLPEKSGGQSSEVTPTEQ